MTAYTEVFRQVSTNDDEPLTVCPDADGLGCVKIEARGDSAISYWGKIDITLTAELAEALGKALILAAAEARPS